ncbi:MAG TPA: TPM domain-containing protein [Nitrospiria bacterium]|jgi:hypothetical protein
MVNFSFEQLKPFILLSFLLFITLGCTQTPQPENPIPFVQDHAGILTGENKKRLASYYQKLLEEWDIHLQVTTLAESPSDINEASIYLFKDYALGSETRGAKGLLLVIDPKGHEVRMEVGYELEPIFPDGFVGAIERSQMVPFFQAGRVGEGIEATVELLVGRAMGDIRQSDYIPEKENPNVKGFSGGAGARTSVQIGEGLQEVKPVRDPSQFGPQSGPAMVLEKYMEVLKIKIKDPNLKLYTPDTRNFFKNQLVTDGQQKNELFRLKEVWPRKKIYTQGSFSVIRFSSEGGESPPYFFRDSPEGWMLDFDSMAGLIGFDFKNQWFFRNLEHEYMFAFQDITFEKTNLTSPEKPQ